MPIRSKDYTFDGSRLRECSERTGSCTYARGIDFPLLLTNNIHWLNHANFAYDLYRDCGYLSYSLFHDMGEIRISYFGSILRGGNISMSKVCRDGGVGYKELLEVVYKPEDNNEIKPHISDDGEFIISGRPFIIRTERWAERVRVLDSSRIKLILYQFMTTVTLDGDKGEPERVWLGAKPGFKYLYLVSFKKKKVDYMRRADDSGYYNIATQRRFIMNGSGPVHVLEPYNKKDHEN